MTISVKFAVESRVIAGKTEWVLRACFESGTWWVVHTWKSKPKKESVDATVKFALRMIEVYHREVVVNTIPYIITLTPEVTHAID